MIPVLYESTESDFNNNGIGLLSDAVHPIVEELRNGSYEFSMTYPETGIHCKELVNNRVILAQPAPGKRVQPFRIYKVTKQSNGQFSVHAEHISYQLSFIPVMPFTASTAASAMSQMKVNAVGDCPFNFSTDIVANGNYTQERPESIRARLGGQQGSILDVYHGEYEWDWYTVHLRANRGSDRGVTLRYGKNIIDLHQEENIDSVYTAVMPYVTVDGSNEVITLPEKYISAPEAASYPFNRILSIDFSDQFAEGEEVTVAKLRQKTEAYIQSNQLGIPKVSITVSFAALWQTEEYKDIAALEYVDLCDTVTVQFERLGIAATAKVVRTVYNVLLERYDVIEIGDAVSTLSSKLVEQERKIEVETTSFMEKAIQHATNLITGGLGGYVVFSMNNQGKPEEILIMDTDNKATARNVWRYNKNGWGHSSTGYNGPFSMAATIDGGIVADYITAGVLNAALVNVINMNASNLNVGQIRANVSGATSYWDLASGDISLQANKTYVGDGQTIGTMKSSIQSNANGLTSLVEETTDELNPNSLQSQIRQTNSTIETSVVKNGQIRSKLSLEDGLVHIQGNTFKLESSNCNIAEDGSFSCKEKFELRNSNNDVVSKIDSEGNFWAKKGHFEDIYVKNQQDSNKVEINKDGTAEFSGIKINNGSGNQSVGISREGKLSAVGAEIDGDIKASGENNSYVRLHNGKIFGKTAHGDEWEISQGENGVDIMADTIGIAGNIFVYGASGGNGASATVEVGSKTLKFYRGFLVDYS